MADEATTSKPTIKAKTRLWAKVLFAILLLGLIALGIIKFAQEQALQVICDNIASISRQPLECRNFKGTLPGRLSIDRISFITPKLRIDVEGIKLRPRLSWLLAGRLTIKDIYVKKLNISILQHSHKPLKLPNSIALPIPIDLQHAHLDLLEVHSVGYPTVQIKNIDTEARLNKLWWNVNNANLELYGQTLRGRASMSPHFPFVVAGKVDSHGGWRQHQWNSVVQAQGSLGTEINLSAEGLVDKTPAKLSTRIKLDAPHTVQIIEAQLSRWPVHEWVPHLPEVNADFSASAQPDNDGWAGTISAKNQAPGTIDQHKLPVLTAHTLWHWSKTSNQLNLNELTFTLPAEGRLKGSLEWHKTLKIVGNADNINLRDFWGKLLPTQLTGTFSFGSTDYVGYPLTANLRQQNDAFATQAVIGKAGIEVQSFLWSRGSSTLNATGKASFSDNKHFDALLNFQQVDPSKFGQFPGGTINGTIKASGLLSPKPEVNFDANINNSSLAHSPLSITGTGQFKPNFIRLTQTKLRLDGLNMALDGSLGATSDILKISGTFDGKSALIPDLEGHAAINGSLSGAIKWPAFSGSLSGSQLQYRDWQLAHISLNTQTDRQLVDAIKTHKMPSIQANLQADGIVHNSVKVNHLAGALSVSNDQGSQHLALTADQIKLGNLQLSDASLQMDGPFSNHQISLTAKNTQQQLTLRAHGQLDRHKSEWSGSISELSSTGSWPFKLAHPSPLTLSRNAFALGAMNLISPNGSIEITQAQYMDQLWSSQGRFSHLPARQLFILSGQNPPAFDLALGGIWDLRFKDTLSGAAKIYRESGDIQPLAELKPLGLTQSTVEILATNNDIQASVRINSQAIGKIQGDIHSALSMKDGRLGLAGITPINGSLDLDIPSLNWLGQWFSTPGYSFGGTLKGSVKIGGNVATPSLNGTMQGRQLTAKASSIGLDLKNGEMDLAIEKDRLLINRLSIEGGKGSLTGHGLLSLKENDPDISVDLVAKELTIMARPDQKLTISGTGRGTLQDSRLAINADVRVDRGVLTLKYNQGQSLDDDIHRSKNKKNENAEDKKIGIFLNTKVDLGEDLEIKHRSFDAKAKGILRLESTPQRQPSLTGNVELDDGFVTAYGQKLALESSTLNFNGPPDNPTLNLKAYRKNLPLSLKGETVAVGIALTGTARKPILKLISTPEMTDREKTSWLVLGQELDLTNKNNNSMSILIASLGAICSGLDDCNTGGVIKTLGIDDVSFEKNTADSTKGIVKVGKQLIPNLYISYGKGYNGAADELQLNYLFNRKWSIELKNNEQNAVDLFYTISFD